MKVFSLLFLFTSASYGQCAMCKAVVESGDKGMAEGVNDGIVYLMAIPYLLIAGIAFFIYKKFNTIKK